MATTIPVPIEFSLPAGWHSVPPDEVGAEEAAFVALHPASAAGFTANISLSGDVTASEIPLAQLADEAIERLRGGALTLVVGRRSEVGSAENPGLTQAVRFSIEIGERPVELTQLQVYIAMQDAEDERRRTVLQVVLSATPEQFEQLVGDFQKFLETIRPEQGGA
ncbi:hypothetical protein [Amycolatopsis sp. lyj-112]|uniref:hypothetical protein n=1 Tax=Amycolatopsis sp. lyj-112 TaxID=2789288 RepID=UPI0039791854